MVSYIFLCGIAIWLPIYFSKFFKLIAKCYVHAFVCAICLKISMHTKYAIS